MKGKKYELLEDRFIWYSGRDLKLFRIRALFDIPIHSVKKGDLGGFVQGYANLSQEGRSWIGGDAKVFDSALVDGDAIVHGRSLVYGNAIVGGTSEIDGGTVAGSAIVSGDSAVRDNSIVEGHCIVSNTSVCELGRVIGMATVEHSVVGECAFVDGQAKVRNAYLHCCARVLGNARVIGATNSMTSLSIGGYACISGDAVVRRQSDFCVVCLPMRVDDIGRMAKYVTYVPSCRSWFCDGHKGMSSDELVNIEGKVSPERGRSAMSIVKVYEDCFEVNKKERNG